MTYVIRSGKTFRFVAEADIEICSVLPAGVYTIRQNPMTKEYFLEPLDSFVIPQKLYGDTMVRARRVLNTFENRPLSTGVHLDGTKGSGKTLLAKTISVLAAEKGIPTIVINQNHSGEDFNQFIQSINQPAIIMFDEFEKVYGWSDQEKILTLFDGVYPTKKLFILTTNDTSGVTRYLKNRPGRIYYTFKYGTLDGKFIEEYLNDNLLDKSQISAFMKYTKVYSFFNFDMLAAAVEEMNRYDESLQDVMNYINISPEPREDETYTMTVVIPSVKYEKVMDKKYRNFSPNTFEQYIDVSEELDDLEEHNKKVYNIVNKNLTDEDGYLVFGNNALSGFDPITNTFTYTIERAGTEVHLTLVRNQTPRFDFNKLAF